MQAPIGVECGHPALGFCCPVFASATPCWQQHGSTAFYSKPLATLHKLRTCTPAHLQSSFIKRLTSLGQEGHNDGLPHPHQEYIEAGWVAEDDHEARLAAGSMLNTGRTDVSTKSNTTAGETVAGAQAAVQAARLQELQEHVGPLEQQAAWSVLCAEHVSCLPCRPCGALPALLVPLLPSSRHYAQRQLLRSHSPARPPPLTPGLPACLCFPQSRTPSSRSWWRW
jgi:hypothetical protein